MEWYEAAFDRLYPVVYGRRDDLEAEKVLASFLGRLGPKEPVLDLACGGGRYMQALSKRGLRAIGLDLSYYLLRECADRYGLQDVIALGDMRHLPFSEGVIGTVMNMFTSFGYFSRDSDNLLVLAEVNRVLSPGGKFLLDYINSEKIAIDLINETQRDSGIYSILEKRRLDTRRGYLKKEVRITNNADGAESVIEERLRLYSKDDLCSMLKTMGFFIEDVFGDYSANPFMDGVSQRTIIIAGKERRP